MKACPECDRAMTRETDEGQVQFKCVCGYSRAGDPYDARIGGEVLNAGETGLMYSRLIQSADLDRVNQVVARDCGKCGLDYMTQIRVGTREVLIWKCKCGNTEYQQES